MSATTGGKIKKRRGRMSGMTWMFLGLLIFFIAAAAFTAIVRPVRQNINVEFAKAARARSYVGVGSFDTTEGGVTFDKVEPPGSPADKAGLVGGDIVTTFDGHPITSDDQIMDLLGETPVGKTVDVVYVRDGETKTAKLTTVSKEEFDRLQAVFNKRPEGHGRFGFDDGNTERVPIAGTKMFGVRLDEISPNLPADMAGIKEGDVVIEFDGVPIRTRDELNSRVLRALPYTTVDVVVMRGTEKIKIPVKMGRQT
jgi:S1-C subfamily serine protease